MLVGLYCTAQSQYNPDEYKKKPLWIQMMDDEKVNYFEIQKAYEAYWSAHTPPIGEGDMDVKQKEKNKKRFSKKEVRDAREDASMRMAIKKYKWWLQRMEPYVQDDGSIQRPTPTK